MAQTVAPGFGDVVEFHLHLDTWGLLVAIVVLYELGIRRLAADYAPRGEPVVTRRQRLLFYTGIVAMGLTSTYPFHDIGESSLFSFHMIEHLVMSLVTPPLLLLGTPWWLIRLTVKPLLPLFRRITHPLFGLIAFNAVLAAIHVPVILELMLTNDLAHFLIHSTLFATALLMWWPVIGPVPELPRLSPFGKIGYLFLQSLVPTIPASFLTLADSPVYKIYETFPRLWGFGAHEDQVVAGLIMKLGGGAILWTAIAIVFFRWAAEESYSSRPPVSRSAR